MIETKPGQGRCVNNCPYHWFEYTDDDGYDFCVKECPEDFGEDYDLTECFVCTDEIDHCLDCEW